MAQEPLLEPEPPEEMLQPLIDVAAHEDPSTQEFVTCCQAPSVHLKEQDPVYPEVHAPEVCPPAPVVRMQLF